MGSTLNSSPILTDCQADTIDSIENSFIMGCCSMLIKPGELIGLENFLSNFNSVVSLPLQILEWDLEGAQSHPFCAIVAQNGNSTLDTVLCNLCFEFFTESVNDVSPHSFLDIDQNLSYILSLADFPCSEILHASTPLDE